MTRSRLLPITPESHRVQIDLVYATDRNFTGKPIFKAAHCLLLEPAEAALRKAVAMAASFGMTLRIFDAYRPPQAGRRSGTSCPMPRSSRRSTAAQIIAAARRLT